MHPDIVWMAAADQRLGLVPGLGGGVAEWSWSGPDGPAHLWRPWSGASDDLYSLASFAMLPWTNRISHGGFEHAGQWHALAPNRAGEPYPIHGDGWLQAWTLTRPADHVAEMRTKASSPSGFKSSNPSQRLADNSGSSSALSRSASTSPRSR